MHEFSICESLVRIVLGELKARGVTGRLARVTVEIGGMHQVVTSSLEAAYEALTRDTPAAGSALVVAARPVSARCRSCGWTGELAMPFFLCGRCGCREVSVTGGRELRLESMEIEDDEPEHPRIP